MRAKKETGQSTWIDPDDAPLLTQADMDISELFTGDHFVRRGRGRPATGSAKEQISVRIDRNILAKLREAGPGWQSRINSLLAQALSQELSCDVAIASVTSEAVAEPKRTGVDPRKPKSFQTTRTTRDGAGRQRAAGD